jgi:hypothetical protein
MIAIVGAVITGLCVYHLATGVPLWEGSKFHPGLHIATAGELWFGIVGGLPFILLGTIIILDAINSTVTIDDQGIAATNLLGRRYFQADWRDISEVRRIAPRPGSAYEVVANHKVLRIPMSVEQAKELAAEIQKRRTDGPSG